jgi:hypothetical protein
VQVVLAVLADAANVTADGKLNILGEFNGIFAKSLPVVWPKMFLVLRLDSTPGEGPAHKLVIRVMNEDGKMLNQIADATIRLVDAAIPGAPRRGQYIIGIERAYFPAYGTYSFEILVNGNSVGSVPLYVYQPGEGKLSHPA